jgi:hypothetical protein
MRAVNKTAIIQNGKYIVPQNYSKWIRYSINLIDVNIIFFGFHVIMNTFLRKIKSAEISPAYICFQIKFHNAYNTFNKYVCN